MQLTGSSDSEDQLRRGDKQDPRRRRSSPPDRHAGHRRQTPPEATAPTSQQEGHRKDESDTPEGKPTNKVHAATKPSLATVVVAAQATTRNPHRCPDIHQEPTTSYHGSLQLVSTPRTRPQRVRDVRRPPRPIPAGSKVSPEYSKWRSEQQPQRRLEEGSGADKRRRRLSRPQARSRALARRCTATTTGESTN